MKIRMSNSPVSGRILPGHITGVAMFVLITAFIMGCGTPEAEQTAAPAESTTPENMVERGRYIVETAACQDCHTPFISGPEGPHPDMSRMLSGHPQDLVLSSPPQLSGDWTWAGSVTNTAFAGPWGISFAFNLTPDPETGLGTWTEEMFVQAIRTGKHLGTPSARPIMPPMPWPVYRNLTDEDLRSVFAYLKTIPPIRNKAPDYQPPATMAQ